MDVIKVPGAEVSRLLLWYPVRISHVLDVRCPFDAIPHKIIRDADKVSLSPRVLENEHLLVSIVSDDQCRMLTPGSAGIELVGVLIAIEPPAENEVSDDLV